MIRARGGALHVQNLNLGYYKWAYIVTMKRFTYKHTLRETIAIAYGHEWTGPVEPDVETRALRDFSLEVFKPLRDAQTDAIRIAGLVKNPKASHFLLFGAARRLRMMWYCYRNVVVYTAPPDRAEPLAGDEFDDLTRDLNVIYINIRGVLDNFAWALLHERDPERVKTLKPSAIGLFQPCIMKAASFTKLAEGIREHNSWNTDLTTRRDPAAHRIPLTVPPQGVTPAEATHLVKLWGDYTKAMQGPDLPSANDALNRMETVGRFVPCFWHDPDESPIPIYPTVPEDLGHVIVLLYAVERFLLDHST
jgi:hypothetical protein